MIDVAQQHIATLEKRVGTDAKSPLFAQLAHYYLKASRAQDALQICDAGLANFPFYTTGHLIKGKALAALNMQAEARREFEFVLDFLPNNETLINLLAQMPPPAEETLTIAPPELLPEVVEPEPESSAPMMSGFDYPVSTLPEVPQSPEPTFNFGGIEPPAVEQQTEVEQQPEPTLPIATPAQNFFDEITQPRPEISTEDTSSFGLNAPLVETPPTFETSPFSEFNFPQPELKIPTPTTESSRGFEFTPPTSDVNIFISATPSEEESFEHYSSLRAKELSGENTVSMEEYLSNKTPVKPQEFTLPKTDSMPQEFTLPRTDSIPTNAQNKIEELTNKLQSAGKITPVINFAQKETPAVSEQDTQSGMGFVTPTLAEIYAKQGWYDDAIKAYRTLAHNKPAEKERYEKRIAELEELKKKSGG
jgi:tetratricopeptide (TPR) repeat protein